MDFFLLQVIVFQTYTNQSPVPIEAKYVFPLDDKAAVCGFEAFINGKHIVGEVRGPLARPQPSACLLLPSSALSDSLGCRAE